MKPHAYALAALLVGVGLGLLLQPYQIHRLNDRCALKVNRITGQSWILESASDGRWHLVPHADGK